MNDCYLIDSILFIYLFFCLATKKLDCKVKEKSWEKKQKNKEKRQHIIWHVNFVLLCNWNNHLLIPIFATHFLQTRFNQARLPCGLNSCIIFYFILFKHGPSPCDLLEEIEELWFGGYGSVPYGPFAWAQPMHATKWARDTGST